MTTPLQLAFRSEQFKFLVGQNESPVMIHKQLLRDLSPPLAALADGPMTEAQLGVAKLEDVEEATVLCFCEYAYTGKYTVCTVEDDFPECLTGSLSKKMKKKKKKRETKTKPVSIVADGRVRDDVSTELDREPVTEEMPRAPQAIVEVELEEPELIAEVALEEPEPEPEPIVEVEPEPTVNAAPGPSKIVEQPRDYFQSQVVDKFSARRMFLLQFRRHHAGVSAPAGGWVTDTVVSENLARHARVYSFADRYGIRCLKDLALCNLQLFLEEMIIYDSRRKDILDLIEYSFSDEHTRDNNAGEQQDPLRELVVHYATCVFEEIGKEPRFLELLERGGSFSREFVATLGKRLQWGIEWGSSSVRVA